MEEQYKVIVNEKGVYAISPAGSENPEGFRDAGKEGSLEACQAFCDVHPEPTP